MTCDFEIMLRLTGGLIVTFPTPSTVCVQVGDVVVGEDGKIRSIELLNGENVSRRPFVECVAAAAAAEVRPAAEHREDDTRKLPRFGV